MMGSGSNGDNLSEIALNSSLFLVFLTEKWVLTLSI